MRSKKGEPSASDVSASGHSDSGKKTKASIANGAAKAFNKLSLKTRLSTTTKSPTGENPTRFQMVHTRDRSPIDSMPLPQIPTTNEEFYAAISKINAQGHLSVLNEPTGRKCSSSSSRKGSQQSPDSQSTMAPRTVTASPASKDILLGPKGNFSLVTIRKEVDPPVTTPPVTASGAVRPAYARRVASEGVPPRPLSERPLIKYSSLHARPSPQVQQQHTSISTSTPSAQHPAISTTSSKCAPSSSSNNRFGHHNRVNSGGERTTVRRRPRRPPSLDSSESDGETLSHRVSYVRHIMREPPKQKTQDPGGVLLHPAAAPVREEEDKTKCYFCQEDCLEPGDNLCGRCQSRFQPQEEVFDYSESEYEDIEFQDSPILSPVAAERPRGNSTSARLSKRRTARHPRSKGKPPRGWSGFSTTVSQQQQLQQLAPRSASSSPTSHVAMELKIVPPQDIKIRTVTSPTRSSGGGGGGGGRSSALHHIQQALKPRVPSSGPGPGDAVRLGKVRSGEIRRVDYPDIIKLKDPSPPNKKKNPPPPPKSFQDTHPLEQQQHHHHQSGGDGFKSWLKYYGDGDMSSDRGSGSAWSDRAADLPASGRSSAVPAARVSTYDRVTSIYDLYASFDEA